MPDVQLLTVFQETEIEFVKCYFKSRAPPSFTIFVSLLLIGNGRTNLTGLTQFYTEMLGSWASSPKPRFPPQKRQLRLRTLHPRGAPAQVCNARLLSLPLAVSESLPFNLCVSSKSFLLSELGKKYTWIL